MNKTKLIILMSLIATCAIAYTNCSSYHISFSQPPAATPDAALQVGLGDAPPIFNCQQNTFASDSYVPGRIDGQNGWESAIGEPFDEEIMNIGATACRGQGVWRISNAYGSGGFGNQPRSPAFTKANGETTLRSPGGGDSMYYEYYFRTKSLTADGSAMDVSFASAPSTDRHDLIRISNSTDPAKGLNLIVRDGVALSDHQVAVKLPLGVWHHIKTVVTSPDGFSNDVLKVYVNGVLAGTYTTWEDWKQAVPQPSLAVKRVMFRIPLVIQVPTAEGFYIDDLQQVSFDSSAPTVPIEIYRTGFEN